MHERTKAIVNSVMTYLTENPGQTVASYMYSGYHRNNYGSAAFRYMLKNKMIELAFENDFNSKFYRLNENFSKHYLQTPPQTTVPANKSNT